MTENATNVWNIFRNLRTSILEEEVTKHKMLITYVQKYNNIILVGGMLKINFPTSLKPSRKMPNQLK